MAYKNISADLSDEDLDLLIQKVKEMEEKLPFAIYLSAEEKQSFQKMGDKSLAFVEKAFEYAEKNSTFVPPFLNVEELQKDLRLAKKLRKMLNFLAPFTEKVEDTYAAVGSEAFSAARIFYSTVKNAAKANVPGSDAIASELGKRFKY